MNSYSYANGNPILLSDPRGESATTWNLYSGSAELGLVGFAGLSFNVGIARGLNEQTGERWVAPTLTFGGVLGSVNTRSASYPNSEKLSGDPFIIGAHTDAGWFSGAAYSPTANVPDDLAGPSKKSTFTPIRLIRIRRA